MLPRFITRTSRSRNLSAEGLERDSVRIGPGSDASVQRANDGDLITGEFDVEYVEVLGDTGGLRRLRNYPCLQRSPVQRSLGDKRPVPTRMDWFFVSDGSSAGRTSDNGECFFGVARL